MTAETTEGRLAYRWVAMFVVLFGTFMVVLDTTVVNLGLPALQREFDITHGVEWVVTAYLAAVGVAQTTSGWLADRYGRRAMFIWAMALFTAASALCAASVTFEMLLAARVLQGVAGGMLMPVAMAMIYELFEPEERGRALGYFGIAIMVAPAVGPVLGGSLVSSLSWRWLFLINVPIGAVGVPVAIRLLRDVGHREMRPFDRVGLALSSTGLVAFLVGVSQGGIQGWGEPLVITLVVAAILFLGGLGSGLAMMSPNIIAMNSVATRQVSQASGLSNVSRQLSAAVGVAALASVFASLRPDDGATVGAARALEPYHDVFLISLALLVAALVAAQFLPGKEKALELQAARRAEAEASRNVRSPASE